MAAINGGAVTYLHPTVIASSIATALDNLNGTAFTEAKDRAYSATGPNALSFSNDDGSSVVYSSTYSTTANYATRERLTAVDKDNGVKITAVLTTDAKNPLLKSATFSYSSDFDTKDKTDDVKFELTDSVRATGSVYKYSYTSGAGIAQAYDSKTSAAGVVTVDNLAYSDAEEKASVKLSGSINAAGAETKVSGVIDNEDFNVVIKAFANTGAGTDDGATTTALLGNAYFRKPIEGAERATFSLNDFSELVHDTARAAGAETTVVLKRVIQDGYDGGDGKDNITGSKGNDIINGGAGDDTINAGAGNDTITVDEGGGNDTINGGDGRDTLVLEGTGWSFRKVGKDLIASNGGTAATTDPETGAVISPAEPGSSITISNIENITYTNAAGNVVTRTADGVLKETLGGFDALEQTLSGANDAVLAALEDKLDAYGEYEWDSKEVFGLSSAGNNTVNFSSTEATGKYTSSSSGVDKLGNTKTSQSFDMTVKSGADEGDTLSAKFTQSISNTVGKFQGNDVLTKVALSDTSSVNHYNKEEDIRLTSSSSGTQNTTISYATKGGIDIADFRFTESRSATTSLVAKDQGSISSTGSLTTNAAGRSIGGDDTVTSSTTKFSYSFSAANADKTLGLKLSYAGTVDNINGEDSVATMSGVELKNNDLIITSASFKDEGEELFNLAPLQAAETDLEAAQALLGNAALINHIYRGSNNVKVLGNGIVVNAGAGDDTVLGGEGDDTIAGGTGTNSLTGGDGADTFVFRQADYAHASKTNLTAIKVTTIRDFDSVDDGDRISFEGFNKITVVNKAADLKTLSGDGAEAQLIYESSTKSLWYDQDGAGGSDFAAMKIATIVGTSDKYTVSDWEGSLS